MKMLSSDTTTTLLVDDYDEDKTLILSTEERLKYFSSPSTTEFLPLSKQPISIWTKIRRLLH